MPDAPAASCALLVVSMHTSIHSEPSEITRHSRTQWFTAYTALSPVIGFLATVACGVASTDLTPASGCQDHTSSPSAASNARQARRRVHRIPPRVRDVASRPSEWDETARDIDLIWVFGKPEYFCKRGWTGKKARALADLPVGQISTPGPPTPHHWPLTNRSHAACCDCLRFCRSCSSSATLLAATVMAWPATL